MYFPFIRGRQYELLALKECAEKNLINDKIIPIIEPVKVTPTLYNTLNTFVTNKLKIALVSNPIVGNYLYELDNQKNEKIKENIQNLIDNNLIYTAHYAKNIKEDTSTSIVIYTDIDSISFKDKFTCVQYNLIPDKREFRRELDNKILLEDHFNKQERNSNYIDIPDETFSTDHIYFDSEGYIGFSDYSIVGSDYSELGFAPYAVAIHIIYQYLVDNKDISKLPLKIAHFVSDTNYDIKDTPGKYYEALKKLVNHSIINQYETYGIKQFMTAYNDKKYEGLGIIKKYSIMHHLELISKILKEKNK